MRATESELYNSKYYFGRTLCNVEHALSSEVMWKIDGCERLNALVLGLLLQVLSIS